MGLKRVICSGCLGMLCLLPMAYISFHFLDLTSQVTGGLVSNITAIGDILPQGYQWIMYIVGSILGVAMICLFPIHWALMYNPGDVMLLLSLILPWILTCAITSGLFAHSPKGGFNTSMAIGIGYMVTMMLPYIASMVVMGGFLKPILDGAASGLTDLPWVLAVALSTMEGAAVGGVFGALIGSLKYEGEGGGGGKKKEKKSKKKIKEPSWDSRDSGSTSSTSKAKQCNNCGAKLTSGDDFCTNCGAKN